MDHELTAKWHELDKIQIGLKEAVVLQPDLSAIQRQIGDMSDLTTEAKDTLVAAINEAARTGGGSGSMDLRVAEGYIQYSTDGATWQNLISVAELKGDKGDPGAQGAKGNTGAAGADGITPTIGSNGNWYLGTTDTGKPSRGDKGDTGATGPQGPKGDPGAAGAPGKDGTNGKDGADGKPGAAGADGVTPHIGDNGNWYLGTTDTGKPSRGATGASGKDGAKGDPGKDGAGMDITGATVGQIAKITAVDASGVPTAWSPVDMPSGGGGGEWEKIIDVEIAESTPMFVRDGINCNEFFIKWSKMENATSTDSMQDLHLNDTLTIRNAVNVTKTGGGVYGWTLCRNNGIAWIIAKSNGALSETNFSTGAVYAPYNLRSGVGSATTMKLVTPNLIYAPVTGKLEVWAR